MKIEEATIKALQGKLTEKLDLVGHQQGICPNCEAPIYDYGDINWFDDSIGQDFICSNCGAHGTEYFNIKFDCIEIEE